MPECRFRQEVRRQLQAFGLNHLAVISGLHVGMVAGVGFYLGLFFGRVLCLLRWSRNSYLCAQLLAAGMALAYSALAGFASQIWPHQS